MDVTKVTGLRKTAFVDKIEKFRNLDPSSQQLIEAAISARKFAYTPYSNFKVGAAFQTKCGKVFKGCNVESCTFTPTTCAERTAIAKAVSEGFLEFSSGAIVAFQEEVLTTPCGVCRQFIMEFAVEDIPLFITRDRSNGSGNNVDGDEVVLCTSAYNLLPNAFRSYQ